MRYLLLLLLLAGFLSSCGDARLEPTAEELPRVEQIKAILYMNKDAFVAPLDGISKEKPMNGVPWKSDKEGGDYAAFLAAFKQSVKGKTDSPFGDLEFRIGAEIPDEVEVDQKFFDLKLVSVEATDRKGKTVQFEEDVRPSFGSKSEASREGGKMISYSLQTVSLLLKPKEGMTFAPPFRGTAVLELTNNDQFALAEITAADKGKDITFNGASARVEDVTGNRVVLVPAAPMDFRFMNVTDAGVEIGLDFDKHKEMNLTMNNPVGSNTSHTMDREIYEIFKATPDIPQEAFFAAVHNHVLQVLRGEKKDLEKVTVVRMLSPINKLVLYKQMDTKPEMVTVEF